MGPHNFLASLKHERFDDHESFFARAREIANKAGRGVESAQAMAIDPYSRTFWLACSTKDVRERAQALLKQSGSDAT